MSSIENLKIDRIPMPPMEHLKSDRKLGRPDVEGDRRRLWDVVSNGGIAIVPSDFGYAFQAATLEANQRVVQAKRRGAHKRQGWALSEQAEREIHILDQDKREMIDCLIKDYDLPIGIIAPYRADHPFLQKVTPEQMRMSTANGTLSTVLNDHGKFLNYIADRSFEELMPVTGSTANLTGSGTKYRVEDIEPEMIELADIVLDYGLCRNYFYSVSSTQINFATMEVIRMGACYEFIAAVLKRHFDVDLPADPGRAVSPGGHVNEFALAEAGE